MRDTVSPDNQGVSINETMIGNKSILNKRTCMGQNLTVSAYALIFWLNTKSIVVGIVLKLARYGYDIP